MRRAVAFATTTAALALSVAAAPFASAAPTQDPTSTVECATLTALGLPLDPACVVVDQVDSALAPVTGEVAPAPAPAPTEPTAPLDPTAPLAPTAPSSDGAVTPAPQPAAAPTSDAQATSATAPAAADLGAAPASSSRGSSPRGVHSSRVPNVPVGSSLELSPLALPSFGLIGTPAATASQLATGSAVANDVVLPAAKAAAQLPDDSKATAVVMAISMLLLAGGLLVDQARKARLPIQL